MSRRCALQQHGVQSAALARLLTVKQSRMPELQELSRLAMRGGSGPPWRGSLVLSLTQQERDRAPRGDGGSPVVAAAASPAAAPAPATAAAASVGLEPRNIRPLRADLRGRQRSV